MEQSTTEQPTTWKGKLHHFIVACVRVLRVTKKPTTEEFKAIIKVSGLGIALIGLIGFIIQLIKEYLRLF